MGKRPVDVDNVVFPPTAEPGNREVAGGNVAYGHELVQDAFTHPVRCSLVVSQVLPALEEIAEPVNRNLEDRLVTEAMVGRCKDLGLNTARPELTKRLGQPGR